MIFTICEKLYDKFCKGVYKVAQKLCIANILGKSNNENTLYFTLRNA